MRPGSAADATRIAGRRIHRWNCRSGHAMDLENIFHRIRRTRGLGRTGFKPAPHPRAVARWQALRLKDKTKWAPLLTSYFHALAPAAALYWISLVYFRPPLHNFAGFSDVLWVAFDLIVSLGVVAGAFRIRAVLSSVQETEQRYQRAVDRAADGILIGDKDGSLLEANSAACRLLGRSRSDVLGLSLPGLVAGQGPDSPLDAFRGILAGETVRHESLLRQSDGKLLAVETSGNLLRDGRVMMILRDISSKKEIENALRESEERYRLLAETANDAIITLNPRSEILFANQATGAIFGYPREEIVGRSLTMLVPDHHTQCHGSISKQCCRTDALRPGCQGFETEGKHKSGQAIPLEICFVECMLQGERISTAFIRDITQRRRSQEALQASEQRYRLLFERNLAGVYRATVDGCFLECNESFARILGASSPEQMLAHNAAAFFSSQVDFAEFVARARQAREQTSMEICRRRIDGSPVWVLENVSLTTGDGGAIELLQGTVMDISDRRQAEERLKASLAEKEVLLKEVHHRVKNNLQIVSSLLALQSKEIRDPELLGPFRETENRVMSIALLHEELYRSKDLARIDFVEYLKTIIRHLASAYDFPVGRIRLAVDAGPLTLDLGTAVPCALIVSELISNALKHAFPDGRQGEVHVLVGSSADGQVTLAVGDNGVGLPPDNGPRGDRSLGLRLLATLVRQLHGTVERRSDQGTEFLITFQNGGQQPARIDECTS
jgi:PAS domain S-box-containing protein